MINIDATLDYIQIINSSYLSGADCREITKRIKSIQSKRKDTKLYLAVIGEFSSGKSTFINALLGFRLLKEAVMPTTACATYIECHAKTLSLKVSFFDGANFGDSEANYDSLKDYLISKYKKAASDLNQIITLITSDQQVAKTVKSLKIKVPGNAIPKNIVIIDTPGFNPGSNSVDNHQEITRNVVENIADAAIILTPQEQAMSATLSRFLNANLKRCLHRCTYIVTKIDTLDDTSSRKEVLDYVRQRIKTDLAIDSPSLYGLSSVTMLPVKQIPLGKEHEWPYLKKAFCEFVQTTWSELQSSKEYVLSEHVNILVKDVAMLCADKLQKKELEIKKDKQFLEDHKVDAIEMVCNKMIVSSSNAINDVFAKLRISFSSAMRKSNSSAASIINKGPMSLTAFQTSKMPEIKTAVEEAAKDALSSLNSSINSKVKNCVGIQLKEMSKVFASHYSQFPSLKPTQTAPSTNLVKFKTPKLNFNIAVSKIEALDSKENKVTGGGAAAGAGVGFLVGGPIGALVGGAIGMFGGIIAGDKSDEMRDSALPLVKSEISSFYSSLRIKVDNEINIIKQQYLNLIKSFAQDHITKYGVAVQKLMQDHQATICDLNEQVKSLRNALIELQNVQDDVEHELAILRIK